MTNETLQTKLMQLEYLNQQIKLLQNHLMEISQAIDELSVLKVGLENLENAKDGEDVLMPMGASAYVSAKLKNNKKIIVGVGAGVFIERKIKDATPIISLQINKLKTQEELLLENLNTMGHESEKMTNEVNQVIQAGQNV